MTAHFWGAQTIEALKIILNGLQDTSILTKKITMSDQQINLEQLTHDDISG